ncbi:hypothetical protein CONPUDRAFT_60792, partial [Coniophora puteana RWD-64-598 SS2]
QHLITQEQLQEAKNCFNQFYIGFKELYYQCQQDCLPFIWQSIHQVLHLVSEVIQKGPLMIYSQLTMEQTISNLGQEIQQLSKLYVNLS